MTDAEELELLELEELESQSSIPVSKEPGDLARLAPKPTQPPRNTSSEGKAMSTLRGIQQGGTFGFADEAGARLSSLPGVGKYLNTPLSDLIQGRVHPAQNYDEALAEIRGDVFNKSEKDNPGHFLGGELLGAMAAPGPGKAKAASKLGRVAETIAVNAGLGGLYGYGKSTDGNALKESGTSALISGAASLLPMGLGALGRKLLGRSAEGVGKAVDDAATATASKIDDAIHSKTSQIGGETQAGSRDIQAMREEVAALPDGHPLKAKLQSYLGSDDALALREMVAGNKLESAPKRVGKAASLREELDALKASRGADIAKGTEELLANPIKKQVLPRAKLLGNRFLPPILGAIAGAALGDEGGAAVGTGLGTALALIQGRPGTVVANMVKSPGFRKMAWEGLHSGGAALEKAQAIPGTLAAILANAFSQPNEQQALADMLAEKP